MIRGLSQATIVAVLLTAVTLQFLQRTDPTFPLLYFTIDSALLEAAVLTRLLLRPVPGSRLFAMVEGAATVGVILSAVVYATVIAPASPSGAWVNTGDDTLVAIATVLLHGVAPAMVAIEYLTRRQPPRLTLLDSVAFVWWPLAYIVTVGGLAVAGIGTVPYPFLRPSESGTFTTIAVVIGLGLLVIIIGVSILAGKRILFRYLHCIGGGASQKLGE